MASSATSLHFLSLAPQSPLSLSKAGGAASAAVHLNPLPPTARLCLSAAAFFSISPRQGFSSFLSRRVAVASDLDQLAVLDEGEASASDLDSDEEEMEERKASYSPNQKFFVGNLPFDVDSAALADLFGSVGSVEMVEVIYDKNTGRSRGFGFVTMASAQEANAAVQQFNNYELEGRALRVNNDPPPPREDREGGFRGGREGGFRGGREGGYSRGGEGGYNRGGEGGYRGGESSYRGGGGGMRSSEGNRCYVGNLAWGVDNSSLESLFSEQGRVVEAKVVTDRESGRSRGFGFVTFSSVDEANQACNKLDGVELGGRSIRVNIAESRPPRREY